jgi:hypothetical protein
MRRSILAALIGTLIVTGCTPPQLATWEQIRGEPFTKRERTRLLALPDAPLTVGAFTIYPDGSTVENVAPAGSSCPQHYAATLRAGWSPDQWSKIDYIMYRESRCDPTVYNGVGRDNSYGLMQLNMLAHRSWVGPLVGWDFTRLLEPETNLRIGKELYERARAMFGCGFQPWRTTKQAHWCN